MTSHLHTAQQVVAGAIMGTVTALLALYFESTVLDVFGQVMDSLPSSVVALIRFGLAMIALPVVFKKELSWVFYRKRKYGVG